MKAEKITGILLVAGALGVMLPYSILTYSFDHPDILRQDPGTVLTRFHAGGTRLIWTWWVFAVSGLPLFGGYVLLNQILEKYASFSRLAGVLGVIGLILQLIGLLRWTFVMPVLAKQYVSGGENEQAVAKIIFEVVHQYGGVILGEHLGQLFTIAWTVLTVLVLYRVKSFPKWINRLGLITCGIYILAQAELFATVLNGVPVWDWAGFTGSTLWIVWLIVSGIAIYRGRLNKDVHFSEIKVYLNRGESG